MSQAENPNAHEEAVAYQREALADKLEGEGAHDLAKQLRGCGEEFPLRCGNCGARKLAKVQCKKRWCPSCQRMISARRMVRFSGAAARMRWPLSIMLSHANEKEASAVFATLMPAFKRFRKTAIWKNNVLGGVVSYEVTNRFGSWNDHLHALVDCRWLAVTSQEPKRGDTHSEYRAKLRAAKHEFTEAWSKCLGDEHAVNWVDRATGGRLMEHIKYTVKGSDLIKCGGKIAPLLRAMKGRRLVQPFGNLYGLGKEWKKEDDERVEKCCCVECGQKGTMMPEYILDAELARKKDHRKWRKGKRKL